MSATLWLEGFTLVLAALPSGSVVGTSTGPQLRTDALTRKVRSGAVNNAPQLKKLLNLNLIM